MVLASDDIRQTLPPACWDQPQVTDSSHVVVILAQPALIDPSNEYVQNSFLRRKLPEDMTRAYIEKYKSHMEKEVFPRMSAYAWSAKQCYIGLANMMTTAASMGIDSCPMEGFEKDRVEALLEIDTGKFEVAVLVAFGYREGDQTLRLRHPVGQMVEFR